MQVPQQQFGIKVVLADLADPAHSPSAEPFNSRAELLSRGSQRVRDLMTVIATRDITPETSHPNFWRWARNGLLKLACS